MGQIYGIKDLKKNEIIYIGQTIRNYKLRWQQHKQQSKERDYALYNAFKKYGINNFQPILIEECNNSFLNEREKFWIEYYHTHITKKGYNITYGGNEISDKLKIPVYQYDLNGNFIQSYTSINEAQWEISGHAGSTIQQAATNQINSAYGFLWSQEKKEKIPPKQLYRKKIYQYSLDLIELNTFNSVKEAAEFLNKAPANISACALGKRKNAYGYIWSYEKKQVIKEVILNGC